MSNGVSFDRSFLQKIVILCQYSLKLRNQLLKHRPMRNILVSVGPRHPAQVLPVTWLIEFRHIGRLAITPGGDWNSRNAINSGTLGK